MSWQPPEDDVLVRGYMVGYGEGVPDVNWQYVSAATRNFTIRNLSRYFPTIGALLYMILVCMQLGSMAPYKCLIFYHYKVVNILRRTERLEPLHGLSHLSCLVAKMSPHEATRL